ncbi:hypothetical protein ACJJTC_000980 [Scirpophaga incertulas]
MNARFVLHTFIRVMRGRFVTQTQRRSVTCTPTQGGGQSFLLTWQPGGLRGKQSVPGRRIQAVHTHTVVSVSASMAGSEDLGVVAAISFVLTYFYVKEKQNDERRRKRLQRRSNFEDFPLVHSSRKRQRDLMAARVKTVTGHIYPLNFAKTTDTRPVRGIHVHS